VIFPEAPSVARGSPPGLEGLPQSEAQRLGSVAMSQDNTNASRSFVPKIKAGTSIGWASVVKARKGFRIGSLNCRTLRTELSQQEVVKLAEELQISVLAVQEHRIRSLGGTSKALGSDWLLVGGSAYNDRACGGVGFVISPKIHSCLVRTRSRAISDRIFSITLETHPSGQLTLISAYAPTATPKYAAATATFYSELQTYISSLGPGSL